MCISCSEPDHSPEVCEPEERKPPQPNLEASVVNVKSCLSFTKLTGVRTEGQDFHQERSDKELQFKETKSSQLNLR